MIQMRTRARKRDRNFVHAVIRGPLVLWPPPFVPPDITGGGFCAVPPFRRWYDMAMVGALPERGGDLLCFLIFAYCRVIAYYEMDKKGQVSAAKESLCRGKQMRGGQFSVLVMLVLVLRLRLHSVLASTFVLSKPK